MLEHQICGTTIEVDMASQSANFFMASLGLPFAFSVPVPHPYHLDCYMLFHQNFHLTIHLSLDPSRWQPHFLIMTVQWHKNGYISSTLYQNPTKDMYLHASSSHPEHATKSIVCNKALKYNCICSDSSKRGSQLKDLHQSFLRLQSPPIDVKKRFSKSRQVPRNNPL